jgi:hypothetical protein
MKRVLFIIALGVLIGSLAGCAPKGPLNFAEVLPKDGWRTYHDDVRGVTCWFYQHPTERNNHFGAGCVPDSAWKK